MVRSFVAVSSLAVAVLPVAMVACSSAPNRTPKAPQPIPEPTPSSAAPTSWSFRYSSGTHRYVVQNTATIELAADTATHRVPITTTAVYTVTLAPTPDGVMTVTGAADSFSVTRGTEIPVPQDDSSQKVVPVPFSARIAATGDVLGFQGARASACDSAVDLLAASGRELLIPVPPSLSDSSEWEDSTSTTTCRGGVPVTTTALQHYRVAGQTRLDGAPAIQLLRTSTIHIAGRGTPENRTDGTFSLVGSGSASATLYLDPRSGVFLGGSSTGSSDITITTARGQLPFHQEVQQEVRLQQ